MYALSQSNISLLFIFAESHVSVNTMISAEQESMAEERVARLFMTLRMLVKRNDTLLRFDLERDC